MAPSPNSNSSGDLKIVDSQPLPDRGGGDLKIVDSRPLPQSGALSRFGQGVYESSPVKPAVDLLTHPIDTLKALGKEAIGKEDLDAIASAVKSGDYKAAASHLGSWLLSKDPMTQELTTGFKLLKPAAENAAKGNFAGAAGNLVGTGAGLGLAAAGGSDTAADLATAAKAGVKAAAPDLARGALKGGVGAAVAESAPAAAVAGPMRWVLMYPAARQIAAGVAKGATAAQDAYDLARTLRNQPDWQTTGLAKDIVPAGSPTIAEQAAGGEDWLHPAPPARTAGWQAAGAQPTPRTVPDFQPATGVQLPPRNLPPAPPAPSLGERLATATAQMSGEDTSLLNGLAQSLAKKQFNKLTPEQQNIVRDLASRGTTSPAAQTASAPQTETPRSMYTASGDLKSPQLRAQEIINANAIAKGDRIGPALAQKFYASGVRADDLGKIPVGRVAVDQIAKGATPGWENIVDDLKSQGIIGAKETTPNLSIPRVQFYLRQLESQQ